MRCTNRTLRRALLRALFANGTLLGSECRVAVLFCALTDSVPERWPMFRRRWGLPLRPTAQQQMRWTPLTTKLRACLLTLSRLLTRIIRSAESRPVGIAVSDASFP